MGRGGKTERAILARELLYGTRARGSGPEEVVIDSDSALAERLAAAPSLPEDGGDEFENIFGDNRFDQASWLNLFAERALEVDGFTDTAVEEEIVVSIGTGNYKSFRAKDWAEPHVGEDYYEDSLEEGRAMAKIFKAYQDSDIPVNRSSLSRATMRLALRSALGRLVLGDRDPANYPWREQQALRGLVNVGADKRLGIRIPRALYN